MSRAGGLGAAVGLGVVLGHAVHRYREVRRASPELRTTQLYWQRPILGPATLWWARRRGRDTAPVPGVAVTRVSADGVDAYLYEPPGRQRPSGALLWIHGGGRVAGRAALDHEFCSYLAREAGAVVLNLDYRLAPEHPFPAGLHDVITALAWLRRGAADLGVDPARIAIGGASAGGGLAAEAGQRDLDAGGRLAFQLLVYPMLDDRTRRVDAAGRGRLSWSPASNRYAWRSYLGSSTEPPPYAVAARRDDLRGLPPAFIAVGDLDLFHDEDVRYAERLTAAGVPCELLVVPGTYHGADTAVTPRPPSMVAFWDTLARALADGLGYVPTPSSGLSESR